MAIGRNCRQWKSDFRRVGVVFMEIQLKLIEIQLKLIVYADVKY